MSEYGVIIVDDEELEDKEFTFVKLANGGMLFLVTRSGAGNARVLEEAWATYRHMLERRLTVVPRQRRDREALADHNCNRLVM